MNKSVIERWIERLESGKVKQAQNRLGYVSGSRCCLGVLCDLAVEDGIIPEPVVVEDTITHQDVGALVYGEGKDASRTGMPHLVCEWAGVRDAGGQWGRDDDLANRNDIGATFEEIAAILRDPPEGLLTDD